MELYEVLSLLFVGGSFLIALLTYIDRTNKRNSSTPRRTCCEVRVMLRMT